MGRSSPGVRAPESEDPNPSWPALNAPGIQFRIPLVYLETPHLADPELHAGEAPHQRPVTRPAFLA